MMPRPSVSSRRMSSDWIRMSEAAPAVEWVKVRLIGTTPGCPRFTEKGAETPDERAVAEAADMTTTELSTLRNKIRKGVIMALDRPVTNADGSSTLGDMIADDEAQDPIEALEDLQQIDPDDPLHEVAKRAIATPEADGD